MSATGKFVAALGVATALACLALLTGCAGGQAVAIDAALCAADTAAVRGATLARARAAATDPACEAALVQALADGADASAVVRPAP